MTRSVQMQVGSEHFRFECTWPDDGYTSAYIADKIVFEARRLAERYVLTMDDDTATVEA